MSNYFKVHLFQYLGETTIHGARNIGDSNRKTVSRVTWLIAFIACWSVLLYFLIVGIIKIRAHETQTRVTFHDRHNATFPSVTICNINAMRKSYLDNNPTVAQIIGGHNPIETDMSDILINFESDPILYTLSVEEEEEKAGHQVKDMVMQCMWGKNGSVIDDCDTDYYFTSRVIYGAGWCHTFHAQRFRDDRGALVQTKVGSGGGLWVRANVEQDEYIFSEYFSAGLRIFVHDPEEYPLVTEQGYAVSPGTETFIAINEIVNKGLPFPTYDPECIDTEAPDFVNPLKYMSTYTQAACKANCVINYSYEQCGCYSIGADEHFDRNSVKLCSYVDYLNCSIYTFFAFESDPSISMACNCKPACQRKTFETRMSTAKYPSNRTATLIKDAYGITQEELENNYLEVRIFFSEFGVTTIEAVESYTWNNLWADIGGQMGLCLGASILSIAELLEFLISSIVKCIQPTPISKKIQVEGFKQNIKTVTNNFVK